ncbi:MAG: DNA-3-methyladenine glycosylase [SAR324 cluster bacterium]|nr:DNA-3-methyladenine glycosylase [SAR324 cluster bacterium]
MNILQCPFFNRDALIVAQDLLGKVIRHYFQGVWLSAMIIETEAYFKCEKGSHASLGYTEKRKGLFMKAGTIYMYYARGGDSLNISCLGEGNAVLIKSGVFYHTGEESFQMLSLMQGLNPRKNSVQPRPLHRLCSGQTLLCKSLGLKVTDWDQKSFDPDHFFIEEVGYRPKKIIQTKRLGIPQGRDEHLPYRFIDFDKAVSCTNNPLSKRKRLEGRDFEILRLS